MEENLKIQNCIQLMMKLPIIRNDDNITAISNLIYEDDDLLNEYLQKVDNRCDICTEDSQGEFLKCEYNRDGDSYRSPFSNKYYPTTEDARYPGKELRELETKFNKIFQAYTRAYYSSAAISSVYIWELGSKIEEGFAVAALVKNIVNLSKEVDTGVWDSNNIINVTFNEETDENGKPRIKVNYKLTTSVVLQMKFDHTICGKVSLAGTVSRQVWELVNIGY